MILPRYTRLKRTFTNLQEGEDMVFEGEDFELEKQKYLFDFFPNDSISRRFDLLIISAISETRVAPLSAKRISEDNFWIYSSFFPGD